MASQPIAVLPRSPRLTLSPATLAAAGALLLGLLLTLVVVSVNGGVFSFTLDDPYIHLALAENIARGHYGINLDEVSAPSSSVLWPLLLAPFAPLTAAVGLVHALNLLCLAGIVYLLADTLRAPLVATSALLLLVLPAIHLIPVAFTGMEHTLQALVAALLARALLREMDEGRCVRWLVPLAALAPLIRYECLALTLVVLGYCLCQGAWRRAARLVALTALPLVAFSLFLWHSDIGLLPASVQVKAMRVADLSLPNLAFERDALRHAPHEAVALLPWLLLSAALAMVLSGTSRRALIAACAILTLHTAFGRADTSGRYELYALVFTVTVLAYVLAQQPRVYRWLRHPGIPALLLVVLALHLIDTPLAARSIHHQQHQSHRFVTAYWQAPVAVNDLGRVSFRNGHKVLDVLGLGSMEAYRLRTSRADGAWLAELAEREGVELALLYASWFPELPAHWRRVATIELTGEARLIGDSTVSVYATDRAAAQRARTALERFAPTLPRGVRMTFTANGAS